MVCSRCGRPFPRGATACATCGAPGIAPLRARGSGLSPARARPAAPRVAVAEAEAAPPYAGFWVRAVGHAIDAVIVYFASAMIAGLTTVGGALLARPILGAVLGGVAGVLVAWLYFALLESSGRQATLGKRALGLAVTDTDGRPIGFGRASARVVAKLVSATPLTLGFAAAAFTTRKQALHDLIASTVVVRRGEGRTAAVVAGVLAAAAGAAAVIGIAAAIAVPSFVRHQHRARSAEATALLASLHEAERAHRLRTGRFAALDAPRGGTPGRARLAWSVDDRAAAVALAWAVEPASTWFTYRVEVAATADRVEAWSACAESDLDGDGQVAAVVLWQPAVDAGGAVVAPPPAPCAHAPALARSPRFEPGDPVGVPVRISPPDVF